MTTKPENEVAIGLRMTHVSLYVTCPSCQNWFALDCDDVKVGETVEDVTCPECEHKFDVEVQEA